MKVVTGKAQMRLFWPRNSNHLEANLGNRFRIFRNPISGVRAGKLSKITNSLPFSFGSMGMELRTTQGMACSVTGYCLSVSST